MPDPDTDGVPAVTRANARADTGSLAPQRNQRTSTGESVALLSSHMFPIGHMPRAMHRPWRQLPPPDTELDMAAGLRFPPQDHPSASLVTGERAPAGTAAEPGPRHDPAPAVPDGDWRRRFVVRPAGELPAEYAWPPAELHPEGGVAAGEPVVLEPDTELDRYGTAEGRVFGRPGTPFERRCLPPEQRGACYRRYRVRRPLPVWQATSAPWFDEPGGGTRYRATYPAADLVALGYLEAIETVGVGK